MAIQFELLKEQSSIIKVIGVGGGGGNAVNHMYKQGISGVDFIVCNTDAQALELSPVPNKVQLGSSLTEGMGAGADPDMGENSAIESIEEIKRMLGTKTKMLFITAGLGGGTGTGASPVLARAAREMGILTVAIVTTPFKMEGPKRRAQAEKGLEELRKCVDSYLVISNDRVREIFGDLTMRSAFAKADDILSTAAKGIAEIITIPGYVNVDFKDVRTVMSESGVAIMGNAVTKGDNRAIQAVTDALASPLLKDNEIEGSRFILLNITSGKKEVTMDEVAIITDYIQEKAGASADLIWGNCIDENLDEELSVTIIATGFQTAEEREKEREKEKIALPLTPMAQHRPQHTPQNPVVAPAETATPLIKPVQTVAEQPQSEQTDLFGPPEDGRQGQQQIIRHTLDLHEHAQEKPQEDLSGFQLKTAPPLFDINLPAVFEAPRPKTDASEKPSESSGKAFETMKVDPDRRGREEQLAKTKERILRLKERSMKMKSGTGLQELENEPAYKRRQKTLEDVPHSSQSQVSRFTLSFEDGEAEIRPNNSFLHDNVD